MKRHIIVNSLLSVLGRSLGLFIPLLIAYWYGSDQETDAFFLAYGLLLFLTTMIGTISEIVIVPFVADLKVKQRTVGEFVGNVLARGAFFVFGILLCLILGLYPILKAVTQFSDQTIRLTWFLTMEMGITALFVCVTSVLNGALNAYKDFKIPALSPGFRSLLVLFFAFYFKKWMGIHAIAFGFVAGEILRMLISIAFFYKRIGPISLNFKSLPEISSFFKAALFQIVGLGFLSFTNIVNQVMASWVGEGGVSLYSYADRLYRVPLQIVIAGTAAVVFSHWANDHSRNAKKVSWPKINKIILFYVFAMGAGALVVFPFRQEIVRLLLARGAFPEEAVLGVGNLFGVLIIGLPFQMIHLFCIRLLVLYKRNYFYMLMGALRFVMSIGLNFWLMGFFGILGIVISVTVLNVIFSGLFYWKTWKAHHELNSQRPKDT